MDVSEIVALYNECAAYSYRQRAFAFSAASSASSLFFSSSPPAKPVSAPLLPTTR